MGINESADNSIHDAAESAPPGEARVRAVVREATHNLYSFGEELAHSLTHGLGAVLAIIGLCVLVARAVLYGGSRELLAGSIFGASLILMYAASTLFHSIPLPRPKHIFRVIDHCLIYVLIAGTYTPFTLIALAGSPWGMRLFVFTWGLAAVGILFKIFTTGRFEWLSLGVYLAMGWCGVVAGSEIIAAVPPAGLWLLLAGGLSYTFGTLFYASTRLRYHHAIWHVFVLAGSAFHFFCVLFYVLPGPPAVVTP